MCASPTRASASARRRRATAISTSRRSCRPREITGADAIHPGYGFLSENAGFAEIVEAHGLDFIGPKPEHIRMMGDKIAAKTADEARSASRWCRARTAPSPTSKRRARSPTEIGYPVLIKAAAGGGGRGMKVAHDRGRARGSLVALARTEAKAAFGDDAVYMEKYLDQPRHIEIQVLADGHGNVVHLGERDCSLQRRHQKVLEEAGSPALDADAARRDRRDRDQGDRASWAIAAPARSSSCMRTAQFSFIEMNTRLQVEHPVTEMITGIDLVREQIRIAAGEPLGYAQEDITFTGHAIECRINAEDPETFMPSPGHGDASTTPPGGLGVRVDCALYAGYRVPPYYDSLVAKLIVHGPTAPRPSARLRRALDEFVVERHQDHPAAASPDPGRSDLPGRRLHDPLARASRRGRLSGRWTRIPNAAPGGACRRVSRRSHCCCCRRIP